MSGWQLETFKESYSFKTQNGISLYKKNLEKKYKLAKLNIEKAKKIADL